MTATFDALRGRARPYVEPIAGAAPAGVSARLEGPYQSVADEVAKLDAPVGGAAAVDWKAVAQGAEKLLRERSKDLLLASWLAHALHVTSGLDGLTTGVTLLAEMLDRYWEAMFPEPKRMRGRVNALQWFLERTQIALGSGDAANAGLETVEALEAAAQRLVAVVREKFADAAPAMSPLTEAVQRLRLAAEAMAPAPEVANPPVPTEAAAPAAGVASAFASPAQATLAGPAEATDFLRGVGESLVKASGVMRRSDTTDAAAYRVLRVGLWLHLGGAPAAEGNRTQVPAPPEALRSQLATLHQNGKWAALLEESECALERGRFWLDLHRYSAASLAALGGAHGRAREALVCELRPLLARMPALPGMSFADGSPFADLQTRAWLEEEVMKADGEARPAAAAGPAVSGEALGEARKLFAARQPAQAIALLQASVAAAGEPRSRFTARLELARLCAGNGLAALARALYQELDREAQAHGLDEWEPALAGECLKGLLSTARAMSKDVKVMQELNGHYQRLCRIDPAAAHEVMT